jgi:hypothetical protein
MYPDYLERHVRSSSRLGSETRAEIDARGRYTIFNEVNRPWDTTVSRPINRAIDYEFQNELQKALGIEPPAPYNNRVDVDALESLLEIINRSDVNSAMSPQGLEYLLREGTAPSAGKMGSTGANPTMGGRSPDYFNARRGAEQALFGIDAAVPPTARPHYGFLENSSVSGQFPDNLFSYEGVKNYGPVVAQWSPSIRANSTFTVGDSLNMLKTNSPDRAIPRPLESTTLEDLLLASAGRGSHSPYNPLGYVEAQMHGGGPRVGDLSGVSVAPNYSDHVARLLQRYGINVPITERSQAWSPPRGMDHFYSGWTLR